MFTCGLRTFCVLTLLAACATSEPKPKVAEARPADPPKPAIPATIQEVPPASTQSAPPVQEVPAGTQAQPDADPQTADQPDPRELVAPEAEAAESSAQVVVDYGDSPLRAAAQRSIAEEMAVKLIDLDPITSALEGPPGRDKLRLTLEESVKIALEGNPDLLVSTYEPLLAETDVEGAAGQFDPVLQGSAIHTDSSLSASQQIRAFGGINTLDTKTTVYQGTIAGRNRLGTQYSFGGQLQREESTFGNFIPEYSGTTTLTLTQPLLRGFGKRVNTVLIQQATNVRTLSQAQLRLSVMNAVADVVRGYWDLVGAIEAVKVQEFALSNAERLMEINQKRRDIGTAADIDVLQAKAGVAMRQSDLITSRARVLDAGDRLKYLLGLKDGDRLSRAQVLPLDRPNTQEGSLLDLAHYEENIDESIQRALDNRPEMTMSEMEILNAQLEELRTRNEMLPQVDLVGSYGQGGRDRELNRVFYGIRDEQDKTYSYGVQASIPIRNRTARNAYHRAQLSTSQSEQRRELTRQQLMLNVQLTGRNVLANQALVASTQQARSLQEVNVVAEERKLSLGTTTSFQVLQVQEDLTLAQTQEVQAQIAYEKALVDFQLAQGTLLENLGVAFEAPDAEPPIGYWRSIKPHWEW